MMIKIYLSKENLIIYEPSKQHVEIEGGQCMLEILDTAGTVCHFCR